MAFAEDQYPVGDLGSGGEHASFRMGVRARAPGRDLDRFDAGTGQDRVEGFGELPGPVADQEPEACGAVAEIHQEIADLLGGPRPVRGRGDPGDVDVAAAGFHDEQAMQALESHRAVHVEEVDGKHRRGLHMQELPPGGVGVPPRCRRNIQVLEDPPDRRCANAVTELEKLAPDPLIPVGAENLCHQVIFVEDSGSTVTPPDPEMIQISNAVGQGAERRGLVQGSVRPVRVVEVLVLAQHDHQVTLVPCQAPVQ